MLKNIFAALVLSVLALPCFVHAQETAKPAPPPLTASAGLKNLYTNVKNFIVSSAEAMPEEHYAFKPTPEVRSFGELLGHIANANYNFCAAPKKTASPNTDNIEKTATTKAALVAAVKESFAFCDSAYELANAGLTEMVKSGQREVGAGYPLTFNVAHNFEHYGNIVTYMRMKGLVPPSSAPR
ncbi:hypothetical protein BH24ACI5_BH24ACI5_29070 [soil metagenome]